MFCAFSNIWKGFPKVLTTEHLEWNLLVANTVKEFITNSPKISVRIQDCFDRIFMPVSLMKSIFVWGYIQLKKARRLNGHYMGSKTRYLKYCIFIPFIVTW